MKMAIPRIIATAFMLATATILCAAEARETRNAVSIVLPLVGIDSASLVQNNSAIQIDLNYQRVLGNHWVLFFLPRFFYGWGGKGSWVGILLPGWKVIGTHGTMDRVASSLDQQSSFPC